MSSETLWSDVSRVYTSCNLDLDPLCLEKAEIIHHDIRKENRYPKGPAWPHETLSRRRSQLSNPLRILSHAGPLSFGVSSFRTT